MYVTQVNADYNGIVLFEPTLLARRYPSLAEGANLFERFTTTEEGDEVLRDGVMVPVLAIDSAGYRVAVRLSDEPPAFPGCDLVAENAEYALRVESRLVVGDLALLAHWLPEVDWQDVRGVPPGAYAVAVRGWRRLDASRKITEAGYEYVLRAQASLPVVTADTGRPMQVLKRD